MDVFPAGDTPETNNAQRRTAIAGRFYKSRKARPCDACRRRKVTCHMPSGPPCQRCCGKDLGCTFEQGPGKRKRPARSPLPLQPAPPPVALLSTPTPRELRELAFDWSSADFSALRTDYHTADTIDALWTTADIVVDGSVRGVKADGPSFAYHLETQPFQDGDNAASAARFDTTTHDPAPSGHASGDSPSLEDSLSDHSALPSSNASSAAGHARQRQTASPAGHEHFSTDGSLQVLSGAFSFYIGPTGVSDTLLLQKEAYGDGGVAPATVKGLQYRCVSNADTDADAASAVLFGITDHALLHKAEPKPGATALQDAWAALWRMLDAPTAWSLVKLYTRFVDPYFPIVAAQQMPPLGAAGLQDGSLSLALLTALCAAALPFVVHDRSLYPLLLRPPSSDELYRLCWLGIAHELHAPNLGTLQACLLMQQRLPTNLYLHDTAFAWSLMATAVSVAQTLGLHRDPAGWTGVPAWERRLRRRLWWTLWATEKWVALARGMPSRLAPAGADDEDADVAPLCHADTARGDTLSWHASHGHEPHLLYLVHLTTILADIQRSYYTLRAARRTSCHLAVAMEIGRPLRARLQSWRDSLPAGLRFRNREPEQQQNDEQPSPSASQTRCAISNILEDSDGSAAAAQQRTLDGTASLHLSYIVTHMMLFRALLRPLDGATRDDSSGNDDSSSDSSASVRDRAVTKGALLCVCEFVEFVEALSPTQWNAFWHGWSRANFAMAGSFMVYLLRIVTAQTPGTSGTHGPRPGLTDEYRELLSWIRRWRWASRVSVNGAAGAKGLTNLMLLRVESFLGEFGELGELDAGWQGN